MERPMEQIYTIPVNEAFEAASDGGGCPFCIMRARLDKNEQELILGASMMEPDTRIRTNELGFCPEHFERLISGGKALPFALMMESHIEHIRESLKGPRLLSQKNATADARLLDTLSHSCYICERVEYHFSRMIDTAAYLWENDPAFREKCAAIKHFCYPHFGRFIAAARARMKQKVFSEFYRQVFAIVDTDTEKLLEDVSFFAKKFDYRYADEPWGDAKDAPRRALRLFCGDDEENAT